MMARFRRYLPVWITIFAILVLAGSAIAIKGPFRHTIGNYIKRDAAELVKFLDLDPQARGIRRIVNLGPSLTTNPAVFDIPASGSNPSLQSVMAPTSGPLRVNPANPRYFMDRNGSTLLLTGSHTWLNFQDIGGSDPPPVFDYAAYLDFLTAHHHNFFRLWVWESPRWALQTTDDDYWFSPMPYQRTGPGIANDDKPKFDLTKFDQAYFDRLRSRVIQAGKRGIYVSVMLFNGWSSEKEKGSASLMNPWRSHPYNLENNINGLIGDVNGNNSGDDLYVLGNPEITAYQEAYVRKVIDTVNDLDNVLYEISNESHSGSQDWQYHMINFIHDYEAGKSQQHPVGMTVEYPSGDNSELFNSPADWISPNSNYENPAPTDGKKVILFDTDHLCGICGDRGWAWKSFTRGYNPVFMDGYDGAGYGVGAGGYDKNDPRWELLRKNLGYILSYSERVNLTLMKPHSELCSTRYCLANPASQGAEYLVYLPAGGSVTVDLSSVHEELLSEWLDPLTGEILPGSKVNGGGNAAFNSPFSEDAVLYLYQSISPIPSTTPPTPTKTRLYLPITIYNQQPPPPQPTAAPGTFLETFDGMPASPQPWNPTNWDVTVHSRDVSTFFQLDPMNADHGPDCSPPPASHPVSSYEDAVFICHDHVMTAINAGGYGLIYLTPNQLVDFSNGEAVIRWDMSTARKSERDWIDVWITPFQDNLQLPLNADFPDLTGEPRNAIHIRMDFSMPTFFRPEVVKEFNVTELPFGGPGIESFLAPSATRRDTFELRLSNTHLKFGMPAYNVWWTDTDLPPLSWNRGIVQFGHHSYDPTKACSNDGTCGPNTWHWDNVSIIPAVPFTILRGTPRFVGPQNVYSVVTFPSPAPADSFLRFAGIGINLEVSFDQGKIWQPALLQGQRADLLREDHFKSYWMKAPPGISQVFFRGQGWFGGDWLIRDITLWSLNR